VLVYRSGEGKFGKDGDETDMRPVGVVTVKRYVISTARVLQDILKVYSQYSRATNLDGTRPSVMPSGRRYMSVKNKSIIWNIYQLLTRNVKTQS
jgi:hypothetical protein